jgi:hypothetical protein
LPVPARESSYDAIVDAAGVGRWLAWLLRGKATPRAVIRAAFGGKISPDDCEDPHEQIDATRSP